MTATNHALTGTAIGLIVDRPLLAIPLALVSHFICDVIPHFGFADPQKTMKSQLFRNYLLGEAAICGLIVATLAIWRPEHWVLAALCAFVAASPDLLSFNRYHSLVTRKKWRPSLYARFAHDIQWFERPIGGVVEVVWAAAMIVLVSPFFK